MADARFSTLRDIFRSAGEGRLAVQAAVAAQQFLSSLAPIITEHFRPLAVASVTNLASPFMTLAPQLFNLTVDIQDMMTNGVPGVRLGIPPSQIHGVVTQPGFDVGGNEQQKSARRTSVDLFRKDYEALKGVLIHVAAVVSVQAGGSTTGSTAAIEKFAGFDYGAVYAPRINELRQFATMNIYAGSVTDDPAKPLCGDDKKKRCFVQQRVSLTLGITISDISGAAHSKIKGNNAFICGIGFTLNRYFRLAVGSAVFRSAAAIASYELATSSSTALLGLE